MEADAIGQVAATAVLGVLLAWALTPHTRMGRRTRARARLRGADPRVGDRLGPPAAPPGPDELEAVEDLARAGVLEPGEARGIRRDLDENGPRDTVRPPRAGRI